MRGHNDEKKCYRTFPEKDFRFKRILIQLSLELKESFLFQINRSVTRTETLLVGHPARLCHQVRLLSDRDVHDNQSAADRLIL